MNLRFITKRIHAYLDYPVAIALMLLPFLLGLGESNPLAFWLSVGTGAVALVLTLLTDHHLGVFRVLPYTFHLTADFAVGIMFLAAPFLFGFAGLDAWFYWINGAAVVSVVSLHNKEEAAVRRSVAA
ncbi:MAG: SPW repeat domain-containing protein [Calditrichia bacterium]